MLRHIPRMVRDTYIRQLRFISVSLFMAVSITACCGDIQISHSVRPDPLHLAISPRGVGKLVDILSQSFLDQVPKDESKTPLTNNWFFTEFHSSTTYDIVYVEIELFATQDESEDRYRETCQDSTGYQYPDNFTFGGAPGNQYCITYIREAREDPEGLCMPQGMYSTQAVFQKGQILIILSEYSENTSNGELNTVISVIADQLNEQVIP